ncbi:hypothetical protein DFH11DRAFT_1600629 [Phellopilus nigrolimitatus]|nr:hypothetical protein DFH11DRAFT_1600629 [Phellopilus nigrolimitatus]
MRESNFAFPVLTGACVCITSQLYDRRNSITALDTTSPLPLLKSLAHLTYLTSTSPRIREILTATAAWSALEPLRHLRPLASWTSPPAAHSDSQSQIL